MSGIVSVLTLAIFLVNALLAYLLSRLYVSNRKSMSYLIWSSGLRLFAISAILELLFSFGVFSDFLAKVYIFTIAMPVLVFSIGYLQFIKSSAAKRYYYYYSTIMALLFAGSLFASRWTALQQSVSYGLLPPVPLALLAMIAFSSSIILSCIAISNYAKARRGAMLAIIPGILVFYAVSILNLQILQLYSYYLELLGIGLIWVGFVAFSGIREYGPGM